MYSSASKSVKCRGYPMSIIVTQSLSWEIELNAFFLFFYLQFVRNYDCYMY